MSGLNVQHLSKSYFLHKTKIEVNKSISFSVPSASLVWIYGNSGAGKSTLLNMISGVDTPDTGSIDWDGKDIASMKDGMRSAFRLNNCGLIFQFFELIKAQSIYDNVAFPLKVQKKSKKEIDEALFPLFEYFGIKELIRKMPDSLSGGERQRASIVRSLSTHPKYIIADEATASLDIENSHKVYAYLKKYIKENNGVGIFVSHDPIIKDYVDAKYEMRDGKLFC